MSTQAPKAVSQFYTAAEKTIINLYFRWKDESEYEKIEDYQLPLEKFAEAAGVKITKMTKRPFGCLFVADNKNYQLKVTNKAYDCFQVG